MNSKYLQAAKVTTEKFKQLTTKQKLAVGFITFVLINFLFPSLLAVNIEVEKTMTETEMISVNFNQLVGYIVNYGILRCILLPLDLSGMTLIVLACVILMASTILPCNKKKVWLLAFISYGICEFATYGFHWYRTAFYWGFDVANGASVPSSPLSFTVLGRVNDYFYWLSIKDFLTGSFGLFTWLLVLVVVSWAALRAYSLMQHIYEENEEAVINAPLMAFSSVIATLCIPYRISSANPEELVHEALINERALNNSGLNPYLADQLTNKAIEVIETDNIVKDFKNNHSTMIFTLMRLAKK